jgi:hypothetical protein
MMLLQLLGGSGMQQGVLRLLAPLYQHALQAVWQGYPQ